ncbi:MAG: PAS domain S-box protein [Candidatus Lokiarchaeota archaeon]|nr:PAS domain S-box protein [Candidatus Harpocratesius repetitus]
MYFKNINSLEILREKISEYLEKVGNIIVELDSNGKIQLINKYGLDLLGVSSDEIIGKSWFENFIPEEERKSISKVFSMLMNGDIENVEFYSNIIITKRKEKRMIKWYNTLLIDDNGKNVGVLSSGTDVTELSKAQENLEKNREMLRITLNYSPLAIISSDLNDVITNCNEATVKLFHAQSEQELIGKNYISLFEENDHKKIALNLKKIRDVGKRKCLRYNFKRLDGSTFPGELSVSLIYDSQKKPFGIVSIIQNISRRIISEETQIKNQKYQALSLMAGGIAHDLNNALMIIQGNLDLIKLNVKSEEIKEMILDMENSIENVKQSVNFLMFYGKPTIKKRRNCNINKIIQSSVKFVSHGSSNVFIIDTAEFPLKVECNRSQISQVITNILINADQSMPNGGEIRVKSCLIKATEIKEKYPQVVNKSRDYVVISVKDQGEGIDPKIAPFIFDPYYTTKETGHGIGLATSLAIIKNHKGYMFFESKKGIGTTFYIFLPLSSKSREIHKQNSNLQKGSRDFSNKRILIMDDDVFVQKIITKMMKHLKITANIVPNDKVCIEEFKAAHLKKNYYDLVILDNVIIGGKSGKEVVKELKKIDPKVKVVLSSGTFFQNLADLGFIDQIQKPYVLEQIEEILKKYL